MYLLHILYQVFILLCRQVTEFTGLNKVAGIFSEKGLEKDTCKYESRRLRAIGVCVLD